MNVKPAETEDLGAIMKIYDAARRFMRSTGNLSQWIDGYPSEELVLEGIRSGKHYVCIHGRQIAGTFWFAVENEVTYGKIYGGRWLNELPYGVIHRMASSGKHRGVADLCFGWCFERCGNIRVDTHRDNRVMQEILKKNGYTECGIIFLRSGTERLAFHKYRRNENE